MADARTEKVIVLGVDGMDPRLTKRLLEEGRLPNMKTLVARGAAREDLVMLGGLPTITPPMWTTLSTGAYPMTHGITCFWQQSHDNLAKMEYALDSTLCRAEQLWNVTAEAGLGTLVWHWPGCSWPPTSSSPNLSVVDGIQPGFVQTGVARVEDELIINASEAVEAAEFIAGGGHANTGAGCIIDDLEVKDEAGGISAMNNLTNSVENIMLTLEDGELAIQIKPYDAVNSPIKPPTGWHFDLPEGAKEFTVLLSGGLLRRPALILPNEHGVYDHVQLYRSKQANALLTELHLGEFSDIVLDMVQKPDGQQIETARRFKLFLLDEAGSKLSLWVSGAIDIHNDKVWHPKALYREIMDTIGYVVPSSNLAGRNNLFTQELTLPAWEIYNNWQADCLNYLVGTGRYQVIFSHLHNVDGIGHNVWPRGMAHLDHTREDEQINQQFMIETYEQTDRYLGRFLHLLDEGWTIFVVSDHGLLTEAEEEPALMGDAFGVNARIMHELGFTVLKTDSQGNLLKEIDWTKTRAVATRTCHIWINLKGRNASGIVDEADQYELEREIIDALYAYREPRSGRRIIAIALRNKDAALLGLSGPEVGDIVYWLEEGFHRVHGDSLSTQQGSFDTSVSPIFVACGQGIQEGLTTSRVIREVDVAPTIAALLGLRMPKQCEGAPVYQILS